MTREDVLREYTRICDVPHPYTVAVPRVGPHAGEMADEIVKLRAQLAGVREAWKFVEANADLCDRGPLGEGWQSKEMSAAVAVLAALDGANV